jgi:hypothetical protein
LVPRVCTVLMMRPSSHYTRNMRLFSRDFRIFMPILQGRMRKAKCDKKHDDTSMQGSLGGMLTRQEREGGATINVGGAHPPCLPSRPLANTQKNGQQETPKVAKSGEKNRLFFGYFGFRCIKRKSFSPTSSSLSSQRCWNSMLYSSSPLSKAPRVSSASRMQAHQAHQNRSAFARRIMQARLVAVLRSYWRCETRALACRRPMQRRIAVPLLSLLLNLQARLAVTTAPSSSPLLPPLRVTMRQLPTTSAPSSVR